MIVQLMGGMGNQMFGAAFGISMAVKWDEEVFFTRIQVDGNIHGGYSLDCFNVDLKFVPRIQQPVYNEPSLRFDSMAVNAAPGSSFVGYWQSEKYFDESTIRSCFYFLHHFSRDASYLGDQISQWPYAFLHVRRGDYLKEPHKSFHGNLGLDYYSEGAERIIRENPDTKFLVFSDDPDWCEQIFLSGASGISDSLKYVDNRMRFRIIRNTTPVEDMWLMSLCRYAVIANSSFSWWGAWLGDTQKDRIVIAPKQWFRDPNMDSSDIVPDRWIKI